jgi:hypothetical protein
MSLVLFLCLTTLCVGLATARIRRISSDAVRGGMTVLATIILLPALLVLGATSAYAANEWRLARFGSQLLEFPLPRSTREVAHVAEVGVLVGNGDHCDFVVTRRLESSLPLDSLKAHFAPLHLRPAIAGGADAGLPLLEIREDSVRHYSVIATDAPYEGIFDVRCY